jgi:hypothetical protein
VPFFTDWTIWEGMVSNTLIFMIQLSCTVVGLAGTAFLVGTWTAHRAGAKEQKNEI